jgi:hypothetical protein
MTYLSYDVRGIQQFIYCIPKLKYMVGGSAIIDRFDTVFVKNKAEEAGAKRIFSGGGKGIVRFEDGSEGLIKRFENELVSEANNMGLDLRLGRSKDLAEAMEGADTLYPFVPESMEGKPCPVS